MLRRSLIAVAHTGLRLIVLRLALTMWWGAVRHSPLPLYKSLPAAWRMAERGVGQTLQRIVTISVGGASLPNHPGDRR